MALNKIRKYVEEGGEMSPGSLYGPVEKCLDCIKDRFDCTICREPMDAPIQTQCGHVFCGNCVTQLSKQSNPKCPLCQKALTNRSLVSRKDIGDMVGIVDKLKRAFSEELQRYFEKRPEANKKREVHKKHEEKRPRSESSSPRSVGNRSLMDDSESESKGPQKKKSLTDLTYRINVEGVIAKPLDLSKYGKRPPSEYRYEYHPVSAIKYVKPLDLSMKKSEKRKLDETGETMLIVPSPSGFATIAREKAQERKKGKFANAVLEKNALKVTGNVRPGDDQMALVQEHKRTKIDVTVSKKKTESGEPPPPPPPQEPGTSIQERKRGKLERKVSDKKLSSVISSSPPPPPRESHKIYEHKKGKLENTASKDEMTRETPSTSRGDQEIAIREPKQKDKLANMIAIDEENPVSDTSAEFKLGPPAPKPPKQYVFCPSRLSKLQTQKLQLLCKMCNGKITRDFSPDVTHLVIDLVQGRVPQTLKYLLAIAQRKWVVIFKWVEECVEKGKVISEDPYETSNFKHCDPGVKRSRQSKRNLFEGYKFYFAAEIYKNLGFTRAEVTMLLTTLGAEVVDSAETHYRDLVIIGICNGNSTEYNDWLNTNKWITVTFDWVIECILEYRLKPFEPKYLCVDTTNVKSINAPKPFQEAFTQFRSQKSPLMSPPY